MAFRQGTQCHFFNWQSVIDSLISENDNQQHSPKNLFWKLVRFLLPICAFFSKLSIFIFIFTRLLIYLFVAFLFFLWGRGVANGFMCALKRWLTAARVSRLKSYLLTGNIFLDTLTGSGAAYQRIKQAWRQNILSPDRIQFLFLRIR